MSASHPDAEQARSAVGALVLAAGAGRRLGMPKALVRWGSELLVERAVRTATEGGCSPVVVVLGRDAEEVLSRASLGAADIVVNPHADSGMGSSLRIGLARLAERDVPAVSVLLVDQPLVSPAALLLLEGAWVRERPAGIRVWQAAYSGRPGHPVLLDREAWDEVAGGAVADVGARAYLGAHPDRVHSVDCSGAGDDADLDTPADLSELLGRATLPD